MIGPLALGFLACVLCLLLPLPDTLSIPAAFVCACVGLWGQMRADALVEPEGGKDGESNPPDDQE